MKANKLSKECENGVKSQEIKYPTWLSNVVIVKKKTRKCCMCADFTDLNKAFSKDPYLLTQIDRLIDAASSFCLLSFMDADSGYNQIWMNLADTPKTAFMTDKNNYYYEVISFGLKNVGATYQRLMDTVFSSQIGRNLEVYMDEMLVNTQK